MSTATAVAADLGPAPQRVPPALRGDLGAVRAGPADDLGDVLLGLGPQHGRRRAVDDVAEPRRRRRRRTSNGTAPESICAAASEKARTP
jgi:hypothetical protein